MNDEVTGVTETTEAAEEATESATGSEELIDQISEQIAEQTGELSEKDKKAKEKAAKKEEKAKKKAAKSAYRKKKKRGKKIVILLIVLILIAAAAYGIYILFFQEEEQTAVTSVTTYGSLNEALEGSGTTTPADSVTYTVSGTVLEWCVEAGDTVEEGDLLYVLDSSEAEEQILDYEVELEELYEELADLQENVNNQYVTASFSGRIENIQVEEGDTVQSGSMLATLVDDSYMTATLYFSYSYEDDIYKGMELTVSIPDQMLILTGTVTGIQYVDYVTTEGMKCFAVDVKVANPGSLTKGTTATGYLTADDGSYIYAANEAELSYNSETTISAEASGEITGVYAVNYERVSSGETLFYIDASSYDSQIETLNKQIENYEENIADLEDSIATEYTRYSDISGQVVTSSYTTDRMSGQDSGSIVIYNLDSMQISINIDELDADYLEVGMDVTVYRTTSSSTVYYNGELTYLSLEASGGSSGVSTFAATITITPLDGEEFDLSAGVTVYYYIDTSGNGDMSETVLAPLSAIFSYDDGYYLVIESEEEPENAFDPSEVGGTVTEYPEGYYAVPVEAGNYNASYIQILSGVDEDVTVFLRYTNAAPSDGDTTSSDGTDDSGTITFDESTINEIMSNMGGGNMGGGNMGGGNMGGFGG